MDQVLLGGKTFIHFLQSNKKALQLALILKCKNLTISGIHNGNAGPPYYSYLNGILSRGQSSTVLGIPLVQASTSGSGYGTMMIYLKSQPEACAPVP